MSKQSLGSLSFDHSASPDFYFYFFYFILTLIWLVSHAELLATCLSSQKTFEGVKTETWGVRLGKYLKEYVVSEKKIEITGMKDFLTRVGVLS